MRIIYEGLETLPLSHAGKGVLTRHLTNIQQGMEIFDGSVYLVGYTDRLITVSQLEVDFDEITLDASVESYDFS